MTEGGGSSDFSDPLGFGDWVEMPTCSNAFDKEAIEMLSSDATAAEHELFRLRNLHFASIMKVYEGCDRIIRDPQFGEYHQKIKQGKTSLASVIKTLTGKQLLAVTAV